MTNVSDKTKQIREAIYGKDIRENIAAGIEAVNDEVNTTTGRLYVNEAYNPTKKYSPLNKVTYNGNLYINIVECTGAYPTDTTHWLKIAERGKDGFSSIQENTITVTGTSVTHIVHGFTVFNPPIDKLEVFYGDYMTLLQKGVHYNENADNLSIDLIDWSVNDGETFKFNLYKNLNDDNIEQVIQDSVVKKQALDASINTAETKKNELQNVINTADTTTYATKGEINSVNSQLAEIAALYASSFGILGDGSDETAKVKAMIDAIPADGAKLVFNRHKKITINGTSQLVISGKKNIVIEGMYIDGTSANVFGIKGGSSNITFRDCYFTSSAQIILLFDCSNITIDNCTFDNTGYGIIQQLNYVSSNVKIINCTAKNMKHDFIEANCASSAPSKNWIISGNHYLGGSGYPTASTENRFVGITALESVTIVNNQIEKVCGDSAIHLEDIKGDILIDGNILDNCVGSFGYLYILSSAKSCVISNSIFKRTDTALDTGQVMNLSSAVYSTPILFTGNRIIGTSKNMRGAFIANQTYTSIIGNYYEDCEVALEMYACSQIVISSNTFKNCNYGIRVPRVSSSGSANDISVTCNHFADTVTNCIYVSRNTNGTAPSQRWLIEGNFFDGNCYGSDTVDFTSIGNIIAAGKTYNMSATYYASSTGYVTANNRQIGSTTLF